MSLRHAALTRAIGAFTAIATSWCLGCSAYEVLVDLAIGGGAKSAMVSIADGNRATGAAMSAAEGRESSPVIRAAPNDEANADGVACGCDGCFAPDPVLQVAAIAGPPGPVADPGTPVAPPSADRVPLVPPPQVIA